MATELPTDESDLWWEVCSVIEWHNRPADGCIDTINRLIAKHPVAKKLPRPVRVQRECLTVRADARSIDQLWRLIHPSLRTKSPPHAKDCPIIVLSVGDAEYLLDGRRRINFWKRNSVAGPHRVLVVSVR